MPPKTSTQTKETSVDALHEAVPNLPAMEERLIQFWRDHNTFRSSVEQRPANKQYVFYDGPPFATGMPHYGHLLGSTSKDVIPRYWTMKGYRVERVWGWDCHGLPIENMIEKKLEIKGGKKGIESLGIANFNSACQTEVLRLDKEWEKIIERLGRWVDFEHNYKTMDSSYMESVWWGFKQLYDKDLVYEGRKVVLYCPRCATPLSNFEIAMDNSYADVTDNSVYVKFKLTNPFTSHSEYFLAWTTTPWTLPGNVALAVKPEASYQLVELQEGEAIWLAQDKVSSLFGNTSPQILLTKKGSELLGQPYEPLFPYVQSDKPNGWTVQLADFVSLEEGTGIVHTAALFGEDDYTLAQEIDLPLVPTLDEEGKFLPFVKLVAGQFYKKAESSIIASLQARSLLWKQEKITHSYPFCYRCATPLYYNAIPAWFIDIQKLKPELLAANKNMNWFPEHLKEGRFGKGLATAPDWNISRSRYWGTPMPIWAASVSTANGSFSMKRRIIGSIAELKQWAVNPEKLEGLTNIHREYLDDIEVWIDNERTIKGKRIPEVFDCWVESGSMPFASKHYPFENKEAFESTYPAQFVSEYIAQTRAWFYTMHVLSVGIFGKHAVDNTLTTGTILAEDGSKMSKSKNNYPDPMTVINQYGVDGLRLYLMSSTVMKAENLNFSEKEVADIRKKVFIIWYNCLSFYKLVAGNTQVSMDVSSISCTHVLDKWLVALVKETWVSVTTAMDSYDVVTASRAVMSLINELSTWYLRRSRDRLRDESSKDSQQILGWSLVTIAQILAPITPFFSEFIYHQLVSNRQSIHLTDWPDLSDVDTYQALLKDMQLVRKIVEKGLATRAENNIRVRQPLERLTIDQVPTHLFSAESPLSEELMQIIAEEVNVKSVIWSPSRTNQTSPEIHVTISTQITPELKAEGEARELIRSIQQIRKKQGLTLSDHVNIEAPSWPDAWKRDIEQKTNTTLFSGPELRISNKT